MSSPRLAALLVAALLAPALGVVAAPAWAQDAAPTVPLLRLEYGPTIPARVKGEVEGALVTTLQEDKRKLKVLDAAATQQRLTQASPALAGCDAANCLTRSGEVLGATTGLSVEVQGEAQIYDMEIKVYDLTDGSTAASEKFSCDVCTAFEVGARFREALQGVMGRVAIKPLPGSAPLKVAAGPGPKQEVKPALVDVQVRVTPAAARIFLDEAPLGAGAAQVKLAPGEYKVRTEADGYEPTRTTLIVKADAPGPVQLDLALSPVQPVAAVEPVVPPPAVPSTQGEGSSTARLVVGGSALALGLGALGAGAWLLGLDGDTTCAAGALNQCPNVYETSAPGTVLVAVGASGATAGFFLLLWDVLTGDDAPPPPAALDLHLGEDSGMVQLRAPF